MLQFLPKAISLREMSEKEIQKLDENENKEKTYLKILYFIFHILCCIYIF